MTDGEMVDRRIESVMRMFNALTATVRNMERRVENVGRTASDAEAKAVSAMDIARGNAPIVADEDENVVIEPGVPVTAQQSAMSSSDYGGAFQWDGRTISHCNFQFGRTMYHLQNVTDATAAGLWCLVVQHSAPGSAVVQVSSASSSDTQTVIPLFEVYGGRIINDYRGMPVIPVYENEAS